MDLQIRRAQAPESEYGSTVPPGAPISPSSSSVPIWAIVGGAVLLIALSIGGSALYFRRRLVKH